MQLQSRLVRWSLLTGLASALIATLGWGLFQPWAANHFGYALPGKDRLPYSIMYAGRSYTNPNECAGDTWCDPDAKICTSTQQLKGLSLWPLKQVGSVPTLFGESYPILVTPHDGQGFVLVLEGDDCYLTYSLEDGP